MYWSQRWRNFGIFCVYVPFPHISKAADTLFSISSPSSSSSTLPAFERRRRNLLRQHPSAISWILSRVSERQLKIMLFQRTLERTILAVWINLWPAPISQSGRVLVWRHSIHVVLEERGLDEMLIIRIKGGEFVLFWFYNCAICMRCWFYWAGNVCQLLDRVRIFVFSKSRMLFLNGRAIWVDLSLGLGEMVILWLLIQQSCFGNFIRALNHAIIIIFSNISTARKCRVRRHPRQNKELTSREEKQGKYPREGCSRNQISLHCSMRWTQTVLY